MNWFLAVMGVLLIAVAMVDAIWTTLTTAGAGPITTRLSSGLWRAVFITHGEGSRRRHRLLMILGTVTLLIILAVWISLLWTGWTLLFSADANSVVHVQTGEPADLSSRIYFTGYTIFTLGVGNFVPQGGVWEVLTAVASINGLFLITLSITYLVPVLSAAAEKRQLAAVASNLGRTPADIVYRAWDGSGFDGLATYLAQLVPLIEMHAQHHAAYPILHYFHSPSLRTAISPSLASLDEALLLLTAGVDPKVRLPAAVIAPVQDAVSGLLSTLEEQYIRASGETPPAPDLTAVEAAGIPVTGAEQFRRAVEERESHRRLLHAFVENDGWTWDDVWKRGQ